MFAEAPPEFVALQWHADTFELPDGAVQLARSDAYEQQAFVFKRAYALQFHIEIDAALATEWGDVPAYAQSLDELLGPGALPTLDRAGAPQRSREHRARAAAVRALARARRRPV